MPAPAAAAASPDSKVIIESPVKEPTPVKEEPETVPHDEVPVGGGGGPTGGPSGGTLIEIDQSWGEPPPRIKKRFGKKKKKVVKSPKKKPKI